MAPITTTEMTTLAEALLADLSRDSVDFMGARGTINELDDTIFNPLKYLIA